MPSELIAAFLLAQLESSDSIQQKRKMLWNLYYDLLKDVEQKGIQLPRHPEYATNNAHIFYLVCKDPKQRNQLIERLAEKGVHAVFHYQSLHKSQYYTKTHASLRALPECERYSECLVRLPLFFELQEQQVNLICGIVLAELTT
jgi:dTDP-4-amino-4,6-dideoxygalactose transaminase